MDVDKALARGNKVTVTTNSSSCSSPILEAGHLSEEDVRVSTKEDRCDGYLAS